MKYKIPPTWSKVSIFDIAAPKQWKTISRKQLLSEGYDVYGANGIIGKYSEYTHEEPTVMITCRGATCGNIHLSNPRSYINGNAMALDALSAGISKKYLFFYLKSYDFNGILSGSAQPQITQEGLKKLEITVPPLNEQHRIVAKIEELFSELDKGIESLKTAREQLKVYRQSLLKHAFEGKLTEQWRKDNPDKLETAEQLLARIKQEREARYQQQLEDWKAAVKQWEANDKAGKKPTKPRKPKWHPLNTENANPVAQWLYTKLENINFEITDGDHQAPPKSERGIPFITISNIRKETFSVDFTDTFFVPNSYYEGLANNRKVKVGDILYTVTGSYGIPVIIDFDRKFCFQRHIGLISPTHAINRNWLFYLLQSPIIFQQAKKTATGTAQKTVALSSLREFDIPLCSTIEQEHIANILEEKLSVVSKNLDDIDESLKKAEVLRQSILKKAFSGKLVPQDPNDEPASLLLERIAAEKAQAEAKAKAAKAAARKAKKPKGKAA